MKHRESPPVANKLRFVQEFELVFSSLTSPFDNYSLFSRMSKRGQELDESGQDVIKNEFSSVCLKPYSIPKYSRAIRPGSRTGVPDVYLSTRVFNTIEYIFLVHFG